MNKKVLMIFIGLFVLFGVSNFIISADETPYSGVVDTSTKVVEASSNFFGGTSGEGVNLTSAWAETGKKWKDSLMASPFVNALDSFFQAINPVFAVLFGMDYSLSLALFLTMGLWFLFFFMFKNMLKVSLFSKWVCLLICFGITIIAAQAGLFSMIVNFLIQFFFGEQTWWMKVIIGVLMLFFVVIMFAVVKRFGKQFAEKRKKAKEEKNRLKIETGAKVGEELTKAVTGEKKS